MKESKKYSLAELSELTKATLIGDPEHLISGVDAIDSARSEDATFLANPKYRSLVKTTEAGVICIDRHTPIEEGKNFLLSDDPSTTFQMIAETLFLKTQGMGFSGIHPTAIIHPTAQLGIEVTIGPHVVIDKDVYIGDYTTVYPFVFIGAHTRVGSHCMMHPHVTIREKCTIGNRVILQPGAVIGSCGFGYTTNARGEHAKLDQLGTVIIEDDVEIGANTTIDRARFKTTRISRGTKIDNLVQIGHNVTLGPHNIIVSQTGIAGSVKTGKNVVMGGQAGVVGHVEIADFTMIASRGGVSKSLKEPGKYAGEPVMTLGDHNRHQVHLRKIAEYVKLLQNLEKRLNQLEEKI